MTHYGYTIKNPEFHIEWLNNFCFQVTGNHSFNIICRSEEEVAFCAQQLRTKNPDAPILRSHFPGAVSKDEPGYVRWVYSSHLKDILVGREPASAQDKNMQFSDVFQVNWASQNKSVPNVSTNSTLFLRGESDTVIIHSKIKYNVIQAET